MGYECTLHNVWNRPTAVVSVGVVFSENKIRHEPSFSLVYLVNSTHGHSVRSSSYIIAEGSTIWSCYSQIAILMQMSYALGLIFIIPQLTYSLEY